MKALAAVALLSCLCAAACSRPKPVEVELADCQMAAARIYPHWQANGEQVPFADYVYFCMQAKGFVIDRNAPKDCPSTDGVVIQTSAACYTRPSAWPKL